MAAKCPYCGGSNTVLRSETPIDIGMFTPIISHSYLRHICRDCGWEFEALKIKPIVFHDRRDYA